MRDVAAVLSWIAERHPGQGLPALFGWSYGAMVGQLTAQRHPALMDALLLFGYPVRPGIAMTPELPDEPPRRPTTAEAAAEDFIVQGSISTEAIAGFVAAALAADPIQGRLAPARAMAGTGSGCGHCPHTLLLEAEFDPLASEMTSTLSCLPVWRTSDKAWVVFPDSDHVAFMETPRDYFLDVLAAFLHHR